MYYLLALLTIGFTCGFFWNRSTDSKAGPPADYDIVLTPDASGSMSGRKNRDSKSALKSFLAELPSGSSRVSVVKFNGSGGKVLRRLTQSVGKARKAVDRISTGGQTPLYDGLHKSYNQLEEEGWSILNLVGIDRSEPPAPNRVIVLSTDGKANVGPGKKRILELGEKIKGEGVRIVTIAIGGGADKDLLKRLASSEDDFHEAEYSGQLEETYKEIVSDLVPI